MGHIRIWWGGQGFGDLPGKPGIVMMVTWAIRLPIKGLETGIWSGSRAQQLAPKAPGPSDRAENVGTGLQAASDGSRAPWKTSGRCRVGVRVSHESG